MVTLMGSRDTRLVGGVIIQNYNEFLTKCQVRSLFCKIGKVQYFDICVEAEMKVEPNNLRSCSI